MHALMTRLGKPFLAVGLGLLVWAGAASSAQAVTLELVSLECLATEDSAVDEIRLEIRGSGYRFDRHLRMRRGSLRQINERMSIADAITVKVWERDNGAFAWYQIDPDDFLGSVRIAARATDGTQQVVIRRYGARYILRYRVTP